jgi:hypothetical protein
MFVFKSRISSIFWANVFQIELAGYKFAYPAFFFLNVEPHTAIELLLRTIDVSLSPSFNKLLHMQSVQTLVNIFQKSFPEFLLVELDNQIRFNFLEQLDRVVVLEHFNDRAPSTRPSLVIGIIPFVDVLGLEVTLALEEVGLFQVLHLLFARLEQFLTHVVAEIRLGKLTVSKNHVVVNAVPST